MTVRYDSEVDVLYISLSEEAPDGTEEVAEGVNLDTTEDGHIAGIEILDASSKMNVDTILSYSLDVKQRLTDRTQRA
jgi:uncharacterized protein YuzE